MKFIYSILILVLLSNLTFAQTKDISGLSQETIRKNKVHKCLEYDYKDSINFFNKYKNGLYTIFDSNGRKIEENSYSSGIVSDFKIIYMYDKSSKEIMWTWIQENSIPKINRVHINTYNSAGKKTGYCEYTPNDEPHCSNYSDNNSFVDTISQIDKLVKTTIYVTFSNNQKLDTVSKYINYFQKEKLDSCVLIGYQENRPVERLTTKYIYTSETLTKSEAVRHYDNQIRETNTTYYLKNGLLENVDTLYYFKDKNGKQRIDYHSRKFIYSYWN